ncbi:MAG: DHH family phosphoesterase [archaeon]
MIYIFGHSNPSADLDSLLGCILTKKYLKRKFNLESIAVSFEKFENKEDKRVLKLLNLKYPKLISKKDINPKDKFVLVDHNSLFESARKYNLKNKIFGIIDHHYDINTPVTKFKIIKKVGSTATIIYNLYRAEKIEITKDDALIFLYAIISDTLNLDCESTTNEDRKAVKEIYKEFNDLEKPNLIFENIFDFKNQANKPAKELIYFDLKNKEHNKVKFAMSVIYLNRNINSKFLKNIENNYPKNNDLYCVCIYNIKEKKSYLFYFGKLARHFKNKIYNRMLSRKKTISPNIRKIIDKIKL